MPIYGIPTRGSPVPTPRISNDSNGQNLGMLFLHGQKTVSEELVESAEYRKCLELAQSNPQIGLERAKSWIDLGGGVVANYCAAISLLNMGLEQDAALNLEKVATRLLILKHSL